MAIQSLVDPAVFVVDYEFCVVFVAFALEVVALAVPVPLDGFVAVVVRDVVQAKVSSSDHHCCHYHLRKKDVESVDCRGIWMAP